MQPGEVKFATRRSDYCRLWQKEKEIPTTTIARGLLGDGGAGSDLCAAVAAVIAAVANDDGDDDGSDDDDDDDYGYTTFYCLHYPLLLLVFSWLTEVCSPQSVRGRLPGIPAGPGRA